MGQWFGGLGILHTMASHRRMGLGSLVSKAASKALAEQGLDVHCNIVFPNPASDAALKAIGFKRIGECAWVHYQARPS